MNAAKSMTASVKEKMQNRAAKQEMKKESEKAASVEKAELKTATDKAGKHEAKAKKHATEAELLREYDMKVAQNAAEKEQKKGAMSQQGHAKHSNEPVVASGHDNAGRDAGTAPDQAAAHTPSPAPMRENLTETNNSSATTTPSSDSPAPAPAPAPAQEYTNSAGRDGFPNPTPPAQGSGVPTHSSLHSGENHAQTTTNTMGGSANTGSYM